MTGKIAAGLLAVVVFAGSVGQASPQSTTKSTHKKTRTVTGCLQPGNEADEYNLTTKDGSAWEIKSDSVRLGQHVGHTVTVTGVVSSHDQHEKEDAKGEMKEDGKDKDAKEHSHMTVTTLSMVSETCQK